MLLSSLVILAVGVAGLYATGGGVTVGTWRMSATERDAAHVIDGVVWFVFGCGALGTFTGLKGLITGR